MDQMKSCLLHHQNVRMRELLTFILESTLPIKTFFYAREEDFRAQVQLRKYDLIVCDEFSDNEEFKSTFKDTNANNLQTPTLVFSKSGVGLELKNLQFLAKPILDTQLVEVIKNLFFPKKPNVLTTLESFVPVRLELLKRFKTNKVPLFLKLSDQKFIKFLHENSPVDKEIEARIQEKKLHELYLERHSLDEFIMDYKKEIFSQEAWQATSWEEATTKVSLNTELLQTFSMRLGLNETLKEIAEKNILISLQLAKTHPELNKMLHHFQKIERFGYADHCTLTAFVCCYLSSKMGFIDELNLRRLTVAAMFHDSTLTTHQYENKKKYLKQISTKESLSSIDVEAIMSHPVLASELLREWSFSPPKADEIVFHHHEQADGTGFPMFLSAKTIPVLSALFIVAEDFVNEYLDSKGLFEPHHYIKQKTSIYSKEPFASLFEAFKPDLEKLVSN